ncbi:MAG: hypothetical protein AB7V16_07125 [Vulcanibacillus sp.]
MNDSKELANTIITTCFDADYILNEEKIEKLIDSFLKEKLNIICDIINKMDSNFKELLKKEGLKVVPCDKEFDIEQFIHACESF